MRFPRLVAAALAGVALAGAGPALGASAAGGAGAAGGATTSVTVELRPHDARVLTALARTHGLSPSRRAALLASVAPTAADRASVLAAARGLGLVARVSTPWSVRLTGPARTMTGLFGNPPAHGAGPVALRMPTALAPWADAALPAHGHVATARTTVSPRDGASFRAAYDVDQAATGAGLTAATIQLSGWDPSVLTTYAHDNGFPDPVASGQYAAVSVDGATTRAFDGGGGQREVALDQEVLLSTAPGARQRAYFASNDDGGVSFIDAVRAVGNDAAAQHIAALSISWGGCIDPNAASFYRAMDNAFAYAEAAGVTVFAASGDGGANDECRDAAGRPVSGPHVDYPAASPYVLGVGGTNLPNNPAQAVAWPYSGGGIAPAQIEPLPTWQSTLAGSGSGRLVPDIASDADDMTGFAADISSDTGVLVRNFVLGGTSLAAPTQAALLTDELAANGFVDGVGDVHDLLYTVATGAAYSSTFLDITSGTNTSPNATGFAATTGYDEVTGFGTPLWAALVAEFRLAHLTAPRFTTNPVVALHVATLGTFTSWSDPVVDDTTPNCTAAHASPPASVTLPADGAHTVSLSAQDDVGACHVATAPVFLDRSAPRASASIRPSGATTATASWSFADPAPSSGALRYVVTIVDSAGTAYAATTTRTAVLFTASAYRSYHLSVVAFDRAGNASPVATAHLYDDLGLGFSRGWTLAGVSAAYRRALHATSMPWAAAVVAGTGRAFTLYVTTCPSCGAIAVYDGSARTALRIIDLQTNRTHALVPVTLLAASTASRHVLTIRVMRTRPVGSTGTLVLVDAATVR